jgi:Ca-activated chloride channel family protein
MFPSTLTPRYNPGAAGHEGTDSGDEAPGLPGSRVVDATRITPPVLLDGTGPLLDVKITLDAGMPLAALESVSHELDVEPRAFMAGLTAAPGGPVTVRLKDGPVLADRDFRLRWRPSPSAAPSSALFTEDFAGERYAMLMLMPPTTTANTAAALGRQTTFIVDTSGSMAGSSMAQAIASLRTGLAGLTPRDTFNVIEFASSARRLSEDFQPASPANIARALDWVEALEADGGTEILAALQLALAAPGDRERVQQVVFITDGSVGNEDELFRFIEERLGERRLFTVGIGSAPNRHFMRGAARFGRGTFTEVSSLANVATQLDGLWARLDAPVMRDVRVAWQGSAPEAWPRRAPDLYLGEPLVVVARLGRDALPAGV